MLRSRAPWAGIVASLLIAVQILACPSSRCRAELPSPRMLLVTQSEGFRHGAVTRNAGELSAAELAMRQLADRTGEFSVRCTQHVATDFTRDELQKCDIVMLYTTGKLPIADADLEYFINDWLRQKGHGLIGVHSATDTYKDYEPYWDLIGGTFRGHPWGQSATVTMTVHDPAHPTMTPFGAEFQIQDEIYEYNHWQPEKVHVLMSLNMDKTDLKRPYHVPVAWVKSVGDGRMFYSNLGHRPETWQDPRFLDSLLAAVRWVTGREDGDATPNPEVSAAHHKSSELASHKAGITLKKLAAERQAREAKRRAEEAARKAKERAAGL